MLFRSRASMLLAASSSQKLLFPRSMSLRTVARVMMRHIKKVDHGGKCLLFTEGSQRLGLIAACFCPLNRCTPYVMPCRFLATNQTLTSLAHYDSTGTTSVSPSRDVPSLRGGRGCLLRPGSPRSQSGSHDRASLRDRKSVV